MRIMEPSNLAAMAGDKCGHGSDGVTGVTGVAAAVARVIGMAATEWYGLRERLRGSHGRWGGYGGGMGGY
jgi:hypothetical protein